MNPEQHRAVREMLGPYVLGQLDGEQAAAVQAHLDGCLACQSEFTELAPLAVALRGVDPARIGRSPAPAPQLSSRVLDEVRGRRRTTVRLRATRRGVAGVLVAAVLAAAFVVGTQVDVPGLTPQRDSATPGAPPPVEAIDLETLVDGVAAEAGLVAHTWGTEIKLEVTGLEPGGTYRVTFIRDDGTRVSAGTFIGTGPNTVRCILNAALLRENATALVVTDEVGSPVLESDITA